MRAYDEIQREVAVELNVKPSSAKTRWIASAKHELGLTDRVANNRGQGAPACPGKYRKAIQHVLLGASLSSETIRKGISRTSHPVCSKSVFSQIDNVVRRVHG
jgi:hypothetical protein